ncbi:TetR/AcrR family transcriptional regulator [Kitasatospora sp. NPDC096128]|uniref:TetR/AcrR family transcriptional regulator n=1 Tax=Kitasatospora sp. NPDC096128 TaxID=3155547 RepID=UPI0033202340
MSSPEAGPLASPTTDTDRRTTVLDSALATFARFGYRKTSMEEVARAAHISRPGLYFLFSSKEALFRAAVTQALERDIAAVEHVLADVDRPLPQRLLEAFDRWAGRYVGPLARDVAVLVEDNPDLLGEIAQAAPRRFEELITEAIAVDSGRQRATPVAQTMISTSIGLKHQAASREFYLERLKVAIALLVH